MEKSLSISFNKYKNNQPLSLSPFRYGRLKFSFMIPGEYILAKADIEINVGRKTVAVTVVNTGDRPVQIGSHYHFFEVNKQMQFEREKALGMRLNIAAGTAVRFEPGEEKIVTLVAFGGNKKIVGFNNLLNNSISTENKADAIILANEKDFKNKD
jgi:urease subunit beta